MILKSIRRKCTALLFNLRAYALVVGPILSSNRRMLPINLYATMSLYYSKFSYSSNLGSILRVSNLRLRVATGSRLLDIAAL